ncbi:hypothetical protein HPB48_015125 [Haemaphysalis longicornis]|uniref:Peptidase M13 N-terminal domain-containing protein n=1 Tax=Haemaphysalis longicornis TaxID=44386 RepID=A0A9J6G6G3_HAELO|nr:hypothetical protein HPB48_015125 [Haemaphysalis longicornis]
MSTTTLSSSSESRSCISKKNQPRPPRKPALAKTKRPSRSAEDTYDVVEVEKPPPSPPRKLRKPEDQRPLDVAGHRQDIRLSPSPSPPRVPRRTLFGNQPATKTNTPLDLKRTATPPAFRSKPSTNLAIGQVLTPSALSTSSSSCHSDSTRIVPYIPTKAHATTDLKRRPSATETLSSSSVATFNTRALTACLDTGEVSTRTASGVGDAQQKGESYTDTTVTKRHRCSATETRGSPSVECLRPTKKIPSTAKRTAEAYSAIASNDADSFSGNELETPFREEDATSYTGATRDIDSDRFAGPQNIASCKIPSKREKNARRNTPFTALYRGSNAEKSMRRCLKDQSCFKRPFQIQRTRKVQAPQRAAHDSSCSDKRNVKANDDRRTSRNVNRRSCVRSSVRSDDSATTSIRKTRDEAAWSDARKAVKTSYISKTWKRSEPETLPVDEHGSMLSELREDHEIRQQALSVLRKECLLYPLAVSLLLCSLLMCAFVLAPVHPGISFNANVPTYPICVSPSCLQNALYLDGILSWKNIDPCDDFYTFVCGRWTSQLNLTPTNYSISFDDDYSASFERQVYSILRAESAESSYIVPVKTLYEKCVDIERTEAEGWNPLLELLFEVSLAGFPLTPPIRSSISVWETAGKLLRKTGANALLTVNVASHPTNIGPQDFLSVGPAERLTASDGVDAREANRMYTAAVFSAIKVLNKAYLPQAHAFSVVRFASELEKLGEQVGNGAALAELRVLTTSPPLREFFGGLLRGPNLVAFGHPSSHILVQFPAVVNRTIELVEQTEAHTVMNYLGVRLMMETSPFLPRTEFTDIGSTLLYARRRQNVPQWQLCIRAVEKALFPSLLASLLTDLNLKTKIATFADVITDIFEALLRVIDSSPYFDAASAGVIRDLLSGTPFRIIAPDWLSDTRLVEHYVTNIPLPAANQSGLESYANSHEYTFLASIARPSSQRWTRSALSTDCWHELDPPTIYVPALVFNVTHAHVPISDAQQSLRIGPRLIKCIFDLVFEVTYAPSSSGEPRLSEHTLQQLRRIENCLDASVGETAMRFTRVRDLLAAHFAYKLFLNSGRSKVKALRLGDKRVLSERQQFFVYLMLQACEKSTLMEQGASKAGSDLTVALRNANDFAEAYACKFGSAMNLHGQCPL